MWQALAGDAANAVLKTATQLYMEKKRREDEEKKRLRELMLRGQQGMGDAMDFSTKGTEAAIQQMLGGFAGALG